MPSFISTSHNKLFPLEYGGGRVQVYPEVKEAQTSGPHPVSNIAFESVILFLKKAPQMVYFRTHKAGIHPCR